MTSLVMSRMSADTVPISGRQTTLRCGPYTAEIASVGASLRSLRYNGRDLILPFSEHQVRPAYRGAVLVPWPNRVIAGRYEFEGVEYQLGINEPSRGHALHGLLAWEDWCPVKSDESSAILSTVVQARSGYPVRLDVQVSSQLDFSGLHTTVTATNTGPGSAPYGAAGHPYLVAGEGRVDDWILELPARKVQQVTPDLLIPTGVSDVSEDRHYDFVAPRPIGSITLDHAFTDLVRDNEGYSTARLTTWDGSGTSMTWGRDCPWVQIHTADLPDAESSRAGLAVEPMTCPPNAFNTRTDLIVLLPGQSHTASWNIEAIPANPTHTRS